MEVVMARGWKRTSSEVRREVIRLAARGCTYQQIIDELDVSVGVVSTVLVPLGGVVRRELWEAPAGRVPAEDRVEIRLGLERGESFAAIGRRIGRHRSTVCREVNGNGGRDRYRPLVAHRRSRERARRPRATKLASDPVLCAQVVAGLGKLWSPEQIARRLRAEFAD